MDIVRVSVRVCASGARIFGEMWSRESERTRECVMLNNDDNNNNILLERISHSHCFIIFGSNAVLCWCWYRRLGIFSLLLTNLLQWPYFGGRYFLARIRHLSVKHNFLGGFFFLSCVTLLSYPRAHRNVQESALLWCCKQWEPNRV